jgi:hypothetical protein
MEKIFKNHKNALLAKNFKVLSSPYTIREYSSSTKNWQKSVSSNRLMDFIVQCTVLQRYEYALFCLRKVYAILVVYGQNVCRAKTVHGTKCSCNLSVHRAEFSWIQSEM